MRIIRIVCKKQKWKNTNSKLILFQNKNFKKLDKDGLKLFQDLENRYVFKRLKYK